MRALALLVLLLATPALGDEWGHYANTRFGYEIDVPPGLLARGEAGDGAGQDFTSPTVTLMVTGEAADAAGFEAAVADWRQWEERQGWNVMFQATTPSEAQFSGRRSGWAIEARAISLCGGRALARYQLEYGTADGPRLRPVIEQLARSFRATGRC